MLNFICTNFQLYCTLAEFEKKFKMCFSRWRISDRPVRSRKHEPNSYSKDTVYLLSGQFVWFFATFWRLIPGIFVRAPAVMRHSLVSATVTIGYTVDLWVFIQCCVVSFQNHVFQNLQTFTELIWACDTCGNINKWTELNLTKNLWKNNLNF